MDAQGVRALTFPGTGGSWTRPGPAALNRWRRCALTLLAADIALAWLVMVAAVTFVHRVWAALVGYALQEESIAEHVSRFGALRQAQVGVLALTILAVRSWARRLPGPDQLAPVRWPRAWWTVLGAAAAADLVVRGLTHAGRPPLSLGGVLPLLLLGEALKIAAAALTIALVLRMPRLSA